MISNKLWFSFFMDLYVTQKVACPSLNYTALVTMSQGEEIIIIVIIIIIIINISYY